MDLLLRLLPLDFRWLDFFSLHSAWVCFPSRVLLHFLGLALRLFDNERTGGSAEQLGFAVAVNVGMVPVEARRLGGGDAELIFEGGVRGLNPSV